jgi:DNA polymerase-3 subunit epsilon
MDFAANFTAIDFETASRREDSACQLGLVIVREGRVVDQACWLIRPRPLYFHRANVEIHGITAAQVRDQPEFAELWPEISAKIGDDCLVAHNASFDLRVLLSTLSSQGQTIPEFSFTCTRAIAKRTWRQHQRYGLKPLSDWLGIRFQHHDALEDAQACAKILLAAGIDREASTLEDLEKRLRLRRGKAGPWGLRGPAGSSRTRMSQRTPIDGSLAMVTVNERGRAPVRAPVRGSSDGAIDLQRLRIRAELIRPLAGARVVLSGRFQVLNYQQALDLVLRSGAECQDPTDDVAANVRMVDENELIELLGTASQVRGSTDVNQST